MRKIISLMLVLSVSLSLVSCGNSDDAAKESEDIQSEVSAESSVNNKTVVPKKVVYSLDEEYQLSLSEATSNFDMSATNDEYALLWKEKADEYYDALVSYYSSDDERFNDRYISPEDMLENVQSMKNDRRSYIDKQIEFYEAHLISMYGSGSILPVKLSEYILDMYRAEALEVYQMCLDLYIDVKAP